MRRLVFRLRPEEAVALAFVVPTTWLTVVAYLYAREGGALGPKYPGGVVRLAIAVALLAGLAVALRLRPGSSLVEGLREPVPLFVCFLIYTSLHDTIGFVNPPSIRFGLILALRPISRASRPSTTPARPRQASRSSPRPWARTRS